MMTSTRTAFRSFFLRGLDILFLRWIPTYMTGKDWTGPGFSGQNYRTSAQLPSLFSDHVFMSYLIWLVVWNFFYFSIYWVNHPNWLIFFRGVGIPPTSNVLLFRCINHQSNFHEPNITIFMGSKSSHKWGVSYRGTPVIIQVMDDHGLVLKPMVTTGVAGRHGRRLKRWNLYLGKL